MIKECKMSTDAESFLEAEEKAENLVKALEKLHDEAKNYNTATKELEAVRLKITEYIESSFKLSSEVNGVIKTIKSIGGPEILKRLTNNTQLLWITMSASIVALAMSIIALFK